ncbi:MAG TPA: radical SAM protein [Planctomycetota bacterium]|jgi:biotin synthase
MQAQREDVAQAIAPNVSSHEAWLRENQPQALEQLWLMADATRARFVGNDVELCGTIKISNHCMQPCGYCGLRMNYDRVARYRMSSVQMLSCARQAVELEYRSVLLQAAGDKLISAEWLADIIRLIRTETGLSVGLSLGERSEADLAMLREAGADAYFLRFQTSDPALYKMLHALPADETPQRLKLLESLRRLGYRLGSGLLVGLPGQTYAGLATDVDLMRSLDLDWAIISPYVPDPTTPIGRGDWRFVTPEAEQVPNSDIETFKVMAALRLLCPEISIPATAALATIGQPDALTLALRRGANALFMELTPNRNRMHYRCYPERYVLEDASHLSGESEVRQLLIQIGRHPATNGAANAVVERASVPASANSSEEQAGRDARPTGVLPIGVCMGSSCFSRGNNQIVMAVKDFIRRHKLEERVALEGHLCQGMCKNGPNLTIGCEQHQPADAVTIIGMLKRHFRLKD